MSAGAIPLAVENDKILPETGPRSQLIEGDIHNAPAPNRYHPDISWNFGWILMDYLQGRSIGKLYHGEADTFTSALFPGLHFNPAAIFAQ